MNPPVLKVLSGQGQADARGSQGNVAEATFAWTFTPGPIALAGSNVVVPGNATGFDLRITYAGGYQATRSGTIEQVDLVPEFSPKTGTIFIGGNLTITNNMQKGSAVTLSSVEYSWDNGGTYTALASTFLAAGGTAPVPAPAQGTGYTLKLRYNYSKAGSPSSATVSHGPFDVSSDWVGSVTGPTSGRTNVSVSFTASVQGGSGNPSFSWCWDGCNIGGVFTAGSATQSHSYRTAGTYVVAVKITDSGISKVVTSKQITITGSGGTGALSVGLNGPTAGKPNQSLSYTATASGGTSPYSYSWCWEACNLGGVFESGPASNSHTYTTEGTFSVTVRTTDGSNRTAVKSISVVISNSTGGGGTLSVGLSGPTTGSVNQSVSFTASVGGGNQPYSYAWCWDGCALGGTFASGGSSASHAYPSAGSHALAVRVTDSSNVVAVKTATIMISGTSQTPPNPNYTVAGATINPFNGDYEATAGAPVTFTASEEHAATYAWDFGDQSNDSGKSVTKTFNEVGSYAVRLLVTGDGSNTFGTAGSSRNFVIKQPEFPCTPSATALCLNRGRFKVEVAWKANTPGTSGDGQAIPLTGDTGIFWFFAPTNLELMVKVLDGTQINGYFWVFSGALSSVEYTITVTDTATDAVHTYHNPEPNFGSVADVTAFPGDSSVAPVGTGADALPSGNGQVPSVQSTVAAEPCVAGPTTLCLNENRFKVEVTYVGDPGGSGQTNPLTSDTGAFWFFQSSNMELMIKVLDGRTINGHFWVFYGALSDVEYTVTVTDTETGAVQTYHNPLHTVASAADLAAF